MMGGAVPQKLFRALAGNSGERKVNQVVWGGRKSRGFLQNRGEESNGRIMQGVWRPVSGVPRKKESKNFLYVKAKVEPFSKKEERGWAAKRADKRERGAVRWVTLEETRGLDCSTKEEGVRSQKTKKKIFPV